MNNYEWSKRASHWRKGFRISFACGVAVTCAMVALVFIAGVSGQAIDQQALVKDFGPLIILFASISAICQLGYSWAKTKMDESSH